jgi:cytochrome c-type biogenesis protein CcmH
MRLFGTQAARITFSLGLALGSAFTAAVFVPGRAPDASGEASAAASTRANAPLDAWHRASAGDGLEQAVRLSAGRLGMATSQAGTASAVVPAGDASVASLLARAEQHRRQREFDRACDLYAEVVARGAMTADAWADYADAQASMTGRLSGAPERAIQAALALDALHAKALWLAASLAHEERRYGDALATWRKLLAVVPAESSDARIVEANIAEATRLAAG